MRAHELPVPREPASASRRSPRRLIAVAAAVLVATVGSLGDSAARAALPPTPTGWTLVFSDDFNGAAGTQPSTANWIYDLGHSYPGGPANWGTGEIQSYTNSPANVSVDGSGNLRITPIRDGAGNWTSARIETQRANFKPPAGGILRIEGRIQMPNVTGTPALGYWPAFWALGGPYRGTFNWPAVGEFDIMENVNGLNAVYAVLHCGVAPGGPCNEFNGIGTNRACPGSTCQSAFHTYRFEWDTSISPNQLRWYVDGQQYHSISQGQLPADTWTNMTSHAGYFILLNVAMGGGFPDGVAGRATPLPTTQSGVPMLVDYVAVYTSGGGQPPPPPPPPPCGTLLSQGRPALASSVESAMFPASAAFDGNGTTRWSSLFSDPQWLRVDLGSTQSISQVRLEWEAAFGRAYQIQTSNDGNTWTTVSSTTTGDGGVDDITLSGSGRYVRVNGTQRGTAWGYSLFEMQVFGGSGCQPPPPSGGPNLFLISGGTLSSTAGGAGTNTVPSAGGTNHDGTPTNPLTYTSGLMTRTFSGGTPTFDLFVDAGSAVGNGTQVRISYDYTGNGSWDRLETYHYFATDPVPGTEHYTQAAGLATATGPTGNLANGRVRVEVWSAIGNASTALGVGNQSIVRLPYN